MFQLLNHPHLSAHIDETDEDALSYMTDLEVGRVGRCTISTHPTHTFHQVNLLCVPQIESIKNTKLSYRIRFHFRRNPYFQNNIIMKELHLGMGGKVHFVPSRISLRINKVMV